MNAFRVKSRTGTYDVSFTPKISGLNAAFHKSSDAKVFFVIDRNVLNHHQQALGELLIRGELLVLDAGEKEKSFIGVDKICAFLVERGAQRNSVLVSVGGGVIQELTAFSANIFRRGIGWICMPTTLLAMVDSCIGGKNSLNFHDLKNQLGTIYSPQAVFIAPAFAKSLPPDEITSGLGEIVKSSLLLGGEFNFFPEIEKFAALEHSSIDNYLLGWIEKSLGVKKMIVEEDEQETGLRRLLNYGHTFGHALESFLEHKIPHGVCVAWGMDVANQISVQLGLLSAETQARVHKVLHNLILNQYSDALGVVMPTQPEIFQRVLKDKKAEGSLINFVCLTEDFRCVPQKIQLSDLAKVCKKLAD